jgi:hypothetical protein
MFAEQGALFFRRESVSEDFDAKLLRNPQGSVDCRRSIGRNERVRDDGTRYFDASHAVRSQVLE